ncbi:MAG: amidohydrolase [Acidimicrobiia bacterium]|nr:amidohydrolase [Acidimicrobiia bacterium]
MPHEEILDPELEICDAHHHLWDLKPPYLPADLLTDMAPGHRITSTVHVEVGSAHYRADGPAALAPVGETEWLLTLDLSGGVAAGIVGHADLTLGAAVQPALEAHIEAAQGRFRGIRHMTAWDGSPDVRNATPDLEPQLLAQLGDGLEALGRLGLSFDAWMFHRQLPELVEVARKHPDVTIVLDHLGGPLGIGPYSGHRDEVWAQTRANLTEVARCENVVLKLGGIGMTMLGAGWDKYPQRVTSQEAADTWGPLIRWCIETFGPSRCMFESNFPVDKRGIDYPVLWNAFKRMTADFSVSERRELFCGTAERVYRLNPAA